MFQKLSLAFQSGVLSQTANGADDGADDGADENDGAAVGNNDMILLLLLFHR